MNTNTSWKNPQLRGERISKTRKEKIANGQIIINVSQLYKKGEHTSPKTEFKKGHGNIGGGNKKGFSHTEEAKRKMSASAKIKLSNPDERLKRSVAVKKYWDNPEARKEASLRTKENWENPKYIKKVMRRREMSGPEIVFQQIIDENNLSYYFNGTLSLEGRELTINRKVPDFVHNTEPKLIEIWGEYFHKGQNPQDKIDFFKKHGYDCLVIWANELKNKEKILERISRF